MNKISMLVAGAAGYVLGTRAGREQYDKITTQARRLWRDPKVQAKASQAQDAASDLGHKAGDKISSKVDEHKGKGSGSDEGSSSTSPAATTPGPTTPPAAGGTPQGGGLYG